MQVVCEGVEFSVGVAVAAVEGVVGQHGGNRDEQAECGHDQGFTHRAGDGVNGSLAGCTDADQGVVDAPHGTQQADERCGGADGCQPGQAVFHVGAFAGHGLAQGAVDELGFAQGLRQGVAFLVRGGVNAVEGDFGERLAFALPETAWLHGGF